MPVKKLKDFLDRENIKYVSLYHSIAYTAQEIAASVHVKGREMAKTVVVKLDGKMAMAVLPASHQVDFERLKRASGAQDAVLATEKEFKDLFPGCDIGAMPPFGNHLGSYFCWQQQWASDFPKGSKFNYPATKSLA